VVLTETRAHQKDPTGSQTNADADARQTMTNLVHTTVIQLEIYLTGILRTARANATRKLAMIHSCQTGIKIFAVANVTGLCMKVVPTERNAPQKDPTGLLTSADADASKTMANSAHMIAQLTALNQTGMETSVHANALQKLKLTKLAVIQCVLSSMLPTGIPQIANAIATQLFAIESMVPTKTCVHQKDPTGTKMNADADAKRMTMNSGHTTVTLIVNSQTGIRKHVHATASPRHVTLQATFLIGTSHLALASAMTANTTLTASQMLLSLTGRTLTANASATCL